MQEIAVLQEIKNKKAPGLCELLDYGETDDQIMYIILKEYGQSLKVMVRMSKFERFTLKTSV